MRRTLLWVVGLLVCIVSLAAEPAWAQTDNAFVGVSAVGILVEPLSDQAARCNVSKGGLVAAVRLPLGASQLRIVQGSLAEVYVNVNVGVLSNGCAASVSVALTRPLTLPNTQALVFNAHVWNAATLMTGSPSNFGQRVNQEITGFTQELIAEWVKANPRQ